MINIENWLKKANDSRLRSWLTERTEHADGIMNAHGNYPRWQSILDELQHFSSANINLDEAVIKIGNADEITPAQSVLVRDSLMQLHPWRKGPFEIFGIHVNSEWRSDMKWERLASRISPLDGRRVLDVGCGNGYYMLRMLGAGASWVLGIDPTILFNVQFRAISQLIRPETCANILPIGIEQLPADLACFDTVFSMGILYHRRSPIEHLDSLFSFLRPGGELILETLVIEGPEQQVLLPESRYAKMRNVWFIPTTNALTTWLERCGFSNIQLIDQSVTTTGEQRSTEWMNFESLEDFLDPDDHEKTIEGYPAPQRAILSAQRPS